MTFSLSMNLLAVTAQQDRGRSLVRSAFEGQLRPGSRCHLRSESNHQTATAPAAAKPYGLSEFKPLRPGTGRAPIESLRLSSRRQSAPFSADWSAATIESGIT